MDLSSSEQLIADGLEQTIWLYGCMPAKWSGGLYCLLLAIGYIY